MEYILNLPFEVRPSLAPLVPRYYGAYLFATLFGYHPSSAKVLPYFFKGKSYFFLMFS